MRHRHGLTRRLTRQNTGWGRGSGDVCSSKSVATMLAKFSLSSSSHDSITKIHPDGVTWMASTVFCEAGLTIYMRVKLFSVSGAIAAQSSCAVPPQKVS